MHPEFTICVSAGEASGDMHAAGLLSAIQESGTTISAFGAGGNRLRETGAEILIPMEKIAVVGITEVLVHLPDLWGSMRSLKRELSMRRPDALLLVDFPDFNFRLAKHAKSLGVPVIYYITPQVWAWRSGRVKFMRETLEKALVIFPFEEPFLRERGVDAVFVGHPLTDPVLAVSSREAFCERHGLDADIPIVALLPGSRNSEVRRILPPLVDAARLLLARGHKIQAVVPWANSLRGRPEDIISDGPVQFIGGDYHSLLNHAAAAATASGTATLETALAGLPEVAVYRLASLTFLLGRMLVSVEHFALPNVVLGRKAVPELLQGEFTPEKIADALSVFLENPTKAKSEAEAVASELREKLGAGGAYKRAAREFLDHLHKNRKTPI